MTGVRQLAAAAVLLAGLGLLLGAGLWGAPPGSVPGVGAVDHHGTLWFHWVVARAVGAGDWHGLVHTDLLFFPWGKDLLRHTGANVLDALVGLPLRALLGAETGHSALLLGFLLANGASTGWVARRLGAGTAGALAAVVLGVLVPYALYETAEGRPIQALLAGFPVLLLLALGSGGARALGAGVVLALLGHQYWFYGLYGGAIVGLVKLGQAVAQGRSWVAGDRVDGPLVLLRNLALTVVVAVALTAPVALPLALDAAGGAVPGLMDLSAWSDPGGRLVDAAGEPLLLHTWQPLSGGTLILRQHGTSLVATLHQANTPWVLLAGLVLWLWRPGRVPRVVGLPILVVLAAAALGPVLVVGGRWWAEPLYVWLLDAVPVLRRLWHPSRALGPLSALLAVLAGIGIGALPRGRAVAAALLGGAALTMAIIGGLAPLPVWSPAPPAGYRCLAQGPDASALIELPWGASQHHLSWQTAHGRPLWGGMWEQHPGFQPAESVAMRQDNTMAAGLVDLGRGRSADWTAEDARALGALGFGYVVLRKDALGHGETGLAEAAARRRARRVADGLHGALGPPLWDDARTAIWAPWGAALPCTAQPPDEDTAPGPLHRDRSLVTHPTVALTAG